MNKPYGHTHYGHTTYFGYLDALDLAAIDIALDVLFFNEHPLFGVATEQ